MARILSIDWGKKRTGLAVTDPLKIIASGLTTIPTHQLLAFLKDYFSRENVERMVIGLPRNLDGSPTDSTVPAQQMIRQLAKHFPHIPIQEMDERFTSSMARQSLIDSGRSKSDRRNKALVDEISATIILQGYLQSIN
ncbi:MAG: Holliday junction resolvase RuvX [Chitinophagaceae bacterium]